MKPLSNAPPPSDSRELAKHFSNTYFKLRAGLAVFAFATPFVLWLVGRIAYSLDLQPSMSAYFWAASSDQCATFPMRTIFVGFLFAISVCLFAYRGLTNRENTLLNLAGLCALGVALFPEQIVVSQAATDPRVALLFETCPAVELWAKDPPPPIHYPSAVALFVLLAIVAWSCAKESLKFLPPGRDAARFRRIYRSIAIAMLVFPIPALALAYLFGLWDRRIFFIEAAGMFTFGTYWAFKSYELSLSSLERDPNVAVQHEAQRKGSSTQQ